MRAADVQDTLDRQLTSSGSTAMPPLWTRIGTAGVVALLSGEPLGEALPAAHAWACGQERPRCHRVASTAR